MKLDSLDLLVVLILSILVVATSSYVLMGYSKTTEDCVLAEQRIEQTRLVKGHAVKVLRLRQLTGACELKDKLKTETKKEGTRI